MSIISYRFDVHVHVLGWNVLISPSPLARILDYLIVRSSSWNSTFGVHIGAVEVNFLVLIKVMVSSKIGGVVISGLACSDSTANLALKHFVLGHILEVVVFIGVVIGVILLSVG